MSVVPQPRPAALSIEAQIAVACAAIDAAPLPAIVVTAATVLANAAAARFVGTLDPSLPADAAALPSGHLVTEALRRAALAAARAAEGTLVAVELAGQAPRCALTARSLTGEAALPIVAWLQPQAPATVTGAASGPVNADDLRAINEHLSLALESADVGIWDIDLRTGRTSWNAQQYALLRMSPEQPPLQFDAWCARVHPDDREAVMAAANKFMAEGGRYEGSFRLVRADGSVAHVKAQSVAIKDAQGKVVRMVGTNRDVTAEQFASLERDQLLKRLQLATQVANIGVWEVELGAGREILDDTTCRILGFGRGPQVRRSEDFRALVHPEDLSAVVERQREMLAGKTPVPGPLAFRILRDGKARHLMSHYVVERDSAGTPVRELGTVLDVTDLRLAEQAALIVAERMEIATQLGGLSVFERDAQDHLVHFDGVLAALYGVAPNEPAPPLSIGVERVLDEDRARYLEARERMRSSDEPVRCEYRARAADGSVRDLLSWRRRRTDAEGRYLGEVGALFDITELRAAERRAKEYGAWLGIATGSAGMGVWEIEVETGNIIADDRAHKLFGELLRPSPTTYEKFAGLIAPEDRERVQAALDRTIRDGGGQVDTEFRIDLPSGPRILSARGEAHRDAQGRSTRVMGVIWDITERRATEAEAREIAERLQLAAVGAGIGSWERSFDGERAVWDEQMYRLFGATPDDGEPHTISKQCLLAEDWPTIDRARLEALRTGEFQVEYRIRRRDGKLRWLSGRGRTRYAANGAPLSIVGVTWDVTEAREAEAALRAKETAERASLAKSEFLSRMSHELRTPLNAIVGFTQLLELDRGDPLSATQRERVGLIRSSGWHLLNLINDVLDLARIESGRSAVSMEVVAWRPVLDEAVAMVAPEAAARGIAIGTRSEGDVPATVWADPVRLRQVLLNLLSNAVKYNRDHGNVQVGLRLDRDTVLMAVRDTGRGMSAGQVSRLFQPFNRLGIDTVVPAGTGIGLAISRRLMQQMEGSIEVDSTPGVGSEFRVRVRVARMEAAPTPSLPRTVESPLSVREDVGGTLLYIEDNPANSVLVEQFLQFRPQVKLYQAADGATGLVMAAVCQPDLVLIDIRLPDMMGDEVLRQLRRQPETRDITCVAVSANAMPHDIEAALAAGFADYWTKPLDVSQFLRGVDRLLPDRAPAVRQVST